MPDPNPFTEDADQVGTGFDITTPSPKRVIVPPSPPVEVAPQPVAAPPGRTFYNPPPMDTQLQQMRVQMKDVPMEQANQAVASALKFQAQRGYQKDLQDGVAPAVALAKWAPMLFGSTAGAASATARAAIAARPARKIVRGPGGQLFVDPGSGQLQPVTPPVGPKVIQPPAAVKEMLSNRNAIRKIEGVTDDNVATAPFTPEGDVLRNRNFALRQQLSGATPVPAPTAPPSAPPAVAAKPATVIRKTKDGRRAVFDASTRQFIRYAD